MNRNSKKIPLLKILSTKNKEKCLKICKTVQDEIWQKAAKMRIQALVGNRNLLTKNGLTDVILIYHKWTMQSHQIIKSMNNMLTGQTIRNNLIKFEGSFSTLEKVLELNKSLAGKDRTTV